MGEVNTSRDLTGTELIGIERDRQIEMFGFVRDDQYVKKELAAVAASVLVSNCQEAGIVQDVWDIQEKHPDELERLIIAGALVAAEIDRIQRRDS